MSVAAAIGATGLYATPGHYLRSRRVTAGFTLDDVALRVETDPPVAAARRAEWLDAIEKDLLPIRPTTALALRAIPELAIDEQLLAHLMEDQAGAGMAVRFCPAPILTEAAAAARVAA